MMRLAVRVVKLGGSLLELPHMADRLREWFAAQVPAVNVLVVGGGALVDQVRRYDEIHRLPAEESHWLAIRAMGYTAELVKVCLSEATLVHRLEELCIAEPNCVQILDVEQTLRDEVDEPNALPCGWHVTSDSIAARVAELLDAKELVLLKSALPPAGSDQDACAQAGYVDGYFPQAAGQLRVRCVDLRGARSTEMWMASGGAISSRGT